MHPCVVVLVRKFFVSIYTCNFPANTTMQGCIPSDVTKLRVDCIRFLDIRPMFREEVKKMISSLLNPHAIKPKIVNGKEVTCKKMIEYIRVR